MTKTVDLKLESVPTVIYACFVLHNVCEQNKVTVDDKSLQEQISSSKINNNSKTIQIQSIHTMRVKEKL